MASVELLGIRGIPWSMRSLGFPWNAMEIGKGGQLDTSKERRPPREHDHREQGYIPTLLLTAE